MFSTIKLYLHKYAIQAPRNTAKHTGKGSEVIFSP